ncbi:arylsulfatase [Erythrobacter sp. Dej080120_24]|nr:arylsulfatase [Erythrobacter sp. Dej080120_24]
MVALNAGTALAQAAPGQPLSPEAAEQAYQALEAQVQQRAGDPAFDYQLGIAALDAGRYGDAIIALQRVLAVQPNNAAARAELARAYALAGDIDTARDQFATVVDDPSLPDPVRQRFTGFVRQFDRQISGGGSDVSGFVDARVGHDSNINTATELDTIVIPLFSFLGPGQLGAGAVAQDDEFYEITTAGPFDRWPTGLGFEYFYGFMGAEDNQWEPNRLYRNTIPIDAPRTPEEGYHLTSDLADEAIAWIDTHRSFAPEKPYFLYFATGAVHSPHHAPEEWIARYRGRFDAGWDVLREEIFARQKRLGVIPQDAVLTPRPAQIPAWDSLNPDEQRLYARQMEVYAGFMAHTDHQIGRLLGHIRQAPGGAENTLVFYIAGDNGALGRALPNYGGGATLAQELERIDQLGGPMVPFNQSQGGWGWMGNTPFQYWKTVASHFGGLRAPMVVSWPGRIADPGGLRQQFQHVTDIVPTIYEAAGLTPLAMVEGIGQQPMDGSSLLASLQVRSAPSTHDTQYFELYGNRAIYHRGWMASELGAYMRSEGEGEAWALYHVAADFTQARDLADAYPEKLAEPQALFDREARANDVYPIAGTTWNPLLKPFAVNQRKTLDFYQGTARIPPAQLRSFNASHVLEAEVVLPQSGALGVLASYGYRNKGFVWYLDNGELVYEPREGMNRAILRSGRRLEAGPALLRYQFICETCPAEGRAQHPVAGTARLFVNDEMVAERRIVAMHLVNGGEAFAMYVGRTGGSRISDGFVAPHPFNGQVKRLSVILDR